MTITTKEEALKRIDVLSEIERLQDEVEAHKDRAQPLMGSEAKRFDKIQKLRTLLSRTIEVFNDTCNCGECGPCKLREEIEGELK